MYHTMTPKSPVQNGVKRMLFLFLKEVDIEITIFPYWGICSKIKSETVKYAIVFCVVFHHSILKCLAHLPFKLFGLHTKLCHIWLSEGDKFKMAPYLWSDAYMKIRSTFH